jgi:hypothetical protein
MRKSTIALLSTLGIILALLLAFVLVGGLALRSRLDQPIAASLLLHHGSEA